MLEKSRAYWQKQVLHLKVAYSNSRGREGIDVEERLNNLVKQRVDYGDETWWLLSDETNCYISIIFGKYPYIVENNDFITICENQKKQQNPEKSMGFGI